MKSLMVRRLGKTDLPVSAMGLGCWVVGGPFWKGKTPLGWGDVVDEESILAIRRGLDFGVTFFDTADVYGAGHSEVVLGQALAGMRQQVVIATKFGNVFDEATRQVTGSTARVEYIRKACEASLHRLNTDYIDLYQMHLDDYPSEHAVKVRETLEGLVKAGKIRSYGWSTDSPDRARVFALGEHCAAIQHQMNVLDDAGVMIALCEKFDLASISRSPLAMGLLTRKYGANAQPAANDVRSARGPDWMKYFKAGRPNPDWLQKRDTVREILTRDGRTLAQGAIAWLWARSPQTIPIPGFRTVSQVEENCVAMRFGPLKVEQMKEIDTLLMR
jgi:aryl-alcohol dehydrogenase-like predicted oxidoreductase